MNGQTGNVDPYIMEHYLVMKKKKSQSFAITLMQLEDIMINKTGQDKKTILYDFTFMWTLKKLNS